MAAGGTNGRPGWGTAVVCGAGMAGLLTARVLSDFFDRVVIIERDGLIDEPVSRRGVPQSAHLHVLLVGGQRILDELFPGFVEEMVSHEASYVCFTSARKRYQTDRWAPRPESDLWTVFCGRGLLEWVVRRRVLELPNVELYPGRRVVGVLASADRDAVCGVQTRSAGDDDGAPDVTLGDLVVDATGRTSAGPSWLESIGYEPPEEIKVNGFWGYASRSYRMPDDFDPDWSALVMAPTGQPGQTRGAALIKQEGGRWLLTLLGCAKDYPPRDEQGFGEWLASLPVPDWTDAIAGATPLTDIEVWRQTFNRLRRYDRLPRHPDGLLFVGDTVGMLNPVYGQGMTVAALGARELRASLIEQSGADGGLVGLAGRFQRRLADTIRFPWVVSAGADQAIPGAEGAAPAAEDAELDRRWRGALLLTGEDPDVNRMFWETLMMARSLDWLYHGDIADRIDAGQPLPRPEVRA